MREWRKKNASEKSKLQETPEKALGSYSSPSTLRKAVHRVHRTLPYSPSKKKAVIRQLIKETFDKPNDLFISTKKPPTRRSIPEDVRVKVGEFFDRDDISWQTPEKKDVVSIKNTKTGNKIKKQKLHDHESVSYTHLDVYKRQSLNSLKQTDDVQIENAIIIFY